MFYLFAGDLICGGFVCAVLRLRLGDVCCVVVVGWLLAPVVDCVGY